MIHIPDPFLTRLMFRDYMCLSLAISSQKIYRKTSENKLFFSSATVSTESWSSMHFLWKMMLKDYWSIWVFLFAFTQRIIAGLYDPYMWALGSETHRIIKVGKATTILKSNINPVPPCSPVNLILKCHIKMPFKPFQGWWFHCCHSQPLPMPKGSSSEEAFFYYLI